MVVVEAQEKLVPVPKIQAGITVHEEIAAVAMQAGWTTASGHWEDTGDKKGESALVTEEDEEAVTDAA
jgi:hypothetical protein